MPGHITQSIVPLRAPILTKRDEEILALLVLPHAKSFAEYTALQALLESVLTRGCILHIEYVNAARKLGLSL